MATSTAKGLFLSMPLELAEHILKFCHVRDVAKFAETCREMHALVYDGCDSYLWRELYLNFPFDDSRRTLSSFSQAFVDDAKVDWRRELQRRVQAESVLLYESPAAWRDRYDSELVVKALNTLASAVDRAPSGLTGRESNDLAWVRNILIKSPILYDTSLQDKHPEARQVQARLRCYLGLAHEDGESEESDKRLQAARNASRCFVYNLRNYTRETFWGPYSTSKDGMATVNWEHLEHIMNVVVMNVREVPNRWDEVWPSWGLESTRAYSAPHVRDRNPNDWAGVEGVWRRVVCFMDYRDLFAFNFSTVHSGPLNPSYFAREPRFAEAVRLMEYDLKIKDTISSSCVGDDPAFPTIHFEGICRGAHSSVGRVEGTVRMLAPGAVRWNFVTAYDGSANSWSAEGVQVGQVGSAFGMGGIWSVAVHEDAGDPAGPFWMWKVQDPLPHDMFLIPIY